MKRLSTLLCFCTLIIASFMTSLNGFAQITLLANYQNNASAPIGTFQGINFREAGFSGLFAIPNTDGKEFWTVSDRGVNVDAANANPAACRPTYDKIYGFKNYAPKIHRIRVSGDSITILQTITMKRPDGTNATGLLNPSGFGSTATEMVSTDTVLNCANFNSKIADKDVWGIDSEGILVDAQGNFWICEEGGPTVWKLNPNGVVIRRFTPYANKIGAQSIDVQIDTVFKYRKNNRGFEGITMTPNGKVYAIIQSPILYPSKSVGEGTRIHRLLEIDPATNTTRMFACLNDGIIGASGANQIRLRDWKFGDMVAVNNTTFLVLEAALRGTTDIKKVYKIDISNATPVTSGLYNGVTLEALVDGTGLQANGITPASKTLFMDLLANGWNPALDKAEGLTIINDSTIAICNDNDFGQSSPLENGIATATTNKSHVYVYGLQGANKLAEYCKLVVSSINGPSNACAFYGNSGSVATYSVSASDAAGFVWTLPAKTTLVSGQGTSSVNVKFQNGFVSGVIAVTITDACGGSSIIRRIYIDKSVPVLPHFNHGPVSVCEFIGSDSTAQYGIDSVMNATSYFWKAPSHATIVSGQGTMNVEVAFDAGFTSGLLSVRAVSACGNSNFATRKIIATVPSKPLAILGRANGICDSARVVVYAVEPVAGATSYLWWTSVDDATIQADSTDAVIAFPAGFVTGSISVKAMNSCGQSAARTITVTSKPASPAAVLGESSVCAGSSQVYAVNPVEGASSYRWSIPAGSSIQSGAGTSSVNLLMGSQSGSIKVAAQNTCGISASRVLDVAVQSCDSASVLSLHPNPTSGIVTITLKTANQESFKVEVFDVVTGQAVFTDWRSDVAVDFVADLRSLPKGIYIVHVVSAHADFYRRLHIE